MLRQLLISPGQLAAGVYGSHNHDVPWECIALLNVRAAYVSARRPVQFARSFDDLDALDVALLECPTGERVALVDHLHKPAHGLEVRAEVSDSATAARVIADVLAGLGLTEAEIAWRRTEWG